MSLPSYRLGVDVGGTFTNLLLLRGDTGETWRAKVPSTPKDQSIGVLEGKKQILRNIPNGADIVLHVVNHGTTAATVDTEVTQNLREQMRALQQTDKPNITNKTSSVVEVYGRKSTQNFLRRLDDNLRKLHEVKLRGPMTQSSWFREWKKQYLRQV